MLRLERLSELGARLSDGEAIDWTAERARTTDDDESRLVRELASIDRFVMAMRSLEVGPAAVAPAGELTGLRIGSYLVQERVGRGGMGEVYRAWHERSGHFVAIKALFPAIAADPVARRRFLREARLARRVAHPSVAAVYDVIEHDARILLVMEWLSGEVLTTALAVGRLAPTDAVFIARSIAEALQAVHRAGIVHRDLKPGNVMLTAEGGVKLMDFGVALQVAEPGRRHPAESVDRLTREGRGVGTIRYMSPEQLRGAPIDARSDLFALGIVFWELLTGSHPFLHATNYATAAAIVDDAPKSDPRAWAPDAAAWQPIVLKLLQKDAARRYPDAGALIADLDRGVTGRRWGLVRIATAVALIALATWLIVDGP